MVPAEVARTRNCPGAGKLAVTRTHLMKDVKAEKRAPKTMAFGAGLPPHLRFVPPKNNVQRLWLDCENVPEDLETMDVVWKGLTHLKSVRGFVEWLQQSEVPVPSIILVNVSMDCRFAVRAPVHRQAALRLTFAHNARVRLRFEIIKAIARRAFGHYGRIQRNPLTCCYRYHRRKL